MTGHTTQGASLEPRGPRRGDGWTLVVVGPGNLQTHRLPAQGAVVIGRDAACDVAIDHARISRQHARLSLGSPCVLEDLGSRNGTTVRGRSLAEGASTPLGPGDSFALGPFTLVLVPEDTATAPPPSTMMVEDPAPATPPAFLVAVARSPLTVLIRGETGAGKEVLAETLHRLSGRTGSMLKLNCAGFNPELLGSELFGH